MSYAQHREGEEELSAQIATAVTAQPPSPLPPRYRPLIGMLASPSRRADGDWQVMGADATCIEAVLAAGGEVRLVPLRSPRREEDPIELVLQTVLEFDGLLFPGSSSDVDPRLYSQQPQAQTAPAEPLLDWWVMLTALAARLTLTPLFAICGGAHRLNVAFGGTLRQHIPRHRAQNIAAGNWTRRVLELDGERLQRCVRESFFFEHAILLSSHRSRHEICCMHHQAPDILAPGFLAWGWSEGIAEGFGYRGPDPWFALATLFHAEARASCDDPLSHFLFGAFLAACQAYAGSQREVLKSARIRDHMLRRLYREPLIQRFLQGPLTAETPSGR